MCCILTASNLPKDLRDMIFSFTDLHSLNRFARVNKLTSNLVKEYLSELKDCYCCLIRLQQMYQCHQKGSLPLPPLDGKYTKITFPNNSFIMIIPELGEIRIKRTYHEAIGGVVFCERPITKLFIDGYSKEFDSVNKKKIETAVQYANQFYAKEIKRNNRNEEAKNAYKTILDKFKKLFKSGRHGH